MNFSAAIFQRRAAVKLIVDINREVAQLLYSFADIVQKLPKLWMSDPLEVMDMMKDYPDFICYRSHDIIGCTSVNNKYSSEIHVNYQFTTDKDDSEFVRATFSMAINSSEEIQKIIEAFWIDGMSAAKISAVRRPAARMIANERCEYQRRLLSRRSDHSVF